MKSRRKIGFFGDPFFIFSSFKQHHFLFYLTTRQTEKGFDKKCRK